MHVTARLLKSKAGTMPFIPIQMYKGVLSVRVDIAPNTDIRATRLSCLNPFRIAISPPVMLIMATIGDMAQNIAVYS